jgi:hypothetical protein
MADGLEGEGQGRRRFNDCVGSAGRGGEAALPGERGRTSGGRWPAAGPRRRPALRWRDSGWWWVDGWRGGGN